jgi:hypothetical protein
MLKERGLPERHQVVADNKTQHSTCSTTRKKLIITGSERVLPMFASFETCMQQESCVIMLSTTFSAGNGFSKFRKVLKNMQQSGRSSAFASSWYMGAA